MKKYIIFFLILISQAASLYPQSSEEYYTHGLSLLENNMLEEAVEELKKSIEIDPQFSDAHKNLGIAYLGKAN